jgi:hypothetical protein
MHLNTIVNFPMTNGIIRIYSIFSSIAGAKVNIIVGSHVWAEDPELAWVDGEVVRPRSKQPMERR